MHPALSVIFFTTLSGAGYGLLIWLGVLLVVERLGGHRAEGTPLLLCAVLLVVASLLIAVGLMSSMLHLGKPGRAWRAFSQWRTSWLSREGVMSLLTYVPVVALLALIAPSVTQQPPQSALYPAWVPALAAAMATCALVTVICTAMIYGSLTTIPAWRHPLVVPGYLLFALLSGGALLAAMSSFAGLTETGVHSSAALITAMAVATVALKLGYWRAIDTQALPVTRGDAVGMPGRDIRVFERPHTDESYITREMAFVVARKHARRLRAIALVLFGVVPVVAAAAGWALPVLAGFAFVIAALAALAGAFVERWLFFAEARHLVTLYY